jgi:crotonobetainyl-CoA:carnitine CoA-transferase CaiB-like acyl-CoA transferase
LQELGAEVIKIEQPVTGDPSRIVSPWGFLNYNVGKKSLSLNLKSDVGQEILHRLIRRKKVDIFIENLGPNVSNRLGFSYPVLHRLNASLIYCSIKGFSSGSKYFDRPAFDAVAQAMSGMMSLTGEPNGEPVRVGNPSIDLGAAAYGTIEVLGAILERRKSEKGKFIEISLLDMSVYWNGYWLTYFGMTNIVPQRLGSGHPGYSPHRVFRTKDNKQILIATLSNAQWMKLSSLLKIKLDSSYDEMKYRISHRTEVEQAIQAAVSELGFDELVERLSLEVPSAKIRSIDEVYNDGELQDFGVLEDAVNLFDGGNKKMVRIARSPLSRYNKNGKKLEPALSAPKLGQDNERILKSIGYKAKEIETFKQSGFL